jgi:superoxide dismutase, Fe-Mn family
MHSMTRRVLVEKAAAAVAGAGAVSWLGGGASPARAAEAASGGAFALPPLPFAEDALEPHIDAMTMRIHHDKHHGAYVEKLNAAVAQAPALAGKQVEDILRHINDVPEAVRTAVRNHGGGHANHSLFWKILKPGGGGAPAGDFAKAVDAAFGGTDGLKKALTDAAMGRFGSGWAWLCVDAGKKLVVESAANQDSPLMEGRTPVLGIDVWEHAYYLKYQNRRADYVAAFFNVVDWSAVGSRYEAAA